MTPKEIDDAHRDNDRNPDRDPARHDSPAESRGEKADESEEEVRKAQDEWVRQAKHESDEDKADYEARQHEENYVKAFGREAYEEIVGDSPSEVPQPTPGRDLDEDGAQRPDSPRDERAHPAPDAGEARQKVPRKRKDRQGGDDEKRVRG